ncbi:MAG: ABC transporter permease [archaeon]|nr:MAG: ABC transporter permease [archaeon]
MIIDYFNLSFKNLRNRRTRSFLTILGIFIGIAAVVALISIGQGLESSVAEQFENLGKDKVIIQSKSLGPPGSASGQSLLLTTRDMEVVEKTKGVFGVVGIVFKTGVIKYRDELEIAFISGVDPRDDMRFEEVQAFKIEEGRFLKPDDKYKAVVGYGHVSGGLWEKPVDLGKKIEIEGVEFRVVGVLESTGNPYDDESVLISKEVMRDIMNLGEEETQLYAKVIQGEDPVEIAERIARELRRFRDEKEGEETFTVQTAEQLFESFQNILGILQAVLIGIAAISLLVGGIGIMNTMYTSVLERTREIGIMKSIGAKNSNILSIFLIEAGMLGLVGGLIGVAIGIGLGKMAQAIAYGALGSSLLQVSFPAWLIIGALVFSFVVGCVAGTLPAVRASRLKPVEALRYE